MCTYTSLTVKPKTNSNAFTINSIHIRMCVFFLPRQTGSQYMVSIQTLVAAVREPKMNENQVLLLLEKVGFFFAPVKR